MTRDAESILHFLTPQQMAEEIVRLDALTAPQVEPQDYTPPLDDDGRLMTGTDHHYTDESIRARIEQLRRFASGSAESAVEWINLDWRGFCNTTRHILSSLYAALDDDQMAAYAEGRKDEAADWNNVGRNGPPPCDGETVFVGINTAGFSCCFNEVTHDGVCSMQGAELSTVQMSGLDWWRVLSRPAESA